MDLGLRCWRIIIWCISPVQTKWSCSYGSSEPKLVSCIYCTAVPSLQNHTVYIIGSQDQKLAWEKACVEWRREIWLSCMSWQFCVGESESCYYLADWAPVHPRPDLHTLPQSVVETQTGSGGTVRRTVPDGDVPIRAEKSSYTTQLWVWPTHIIGLFKSSSGTQEYFDVAFFRKDDS